jgi:LacI family transcriptional regulator
MERLGYRPNELARGLKAQRSAAIGMIVPNLSDPFTANAVHAVQEVARANGHVVILASSGGDLDVERSEIVSLVGRQIDGLIVAPADSRTDSFSDIMPNGVHVVTFDQLIRNADLDSVTVTNRRSAREATGHLISHGLRRVVAIGARPHLYTCRERVAGYRAAMKTASLESRVCLVEHESMLTAAWIEEQVLGLQKADAILTLNWVCTILSLRGLRELGRTAGRDIPMLSFDDFDLADMLRPSLSVVQQPAEMLGREAATLLFERLKGGSGESRAVVLPTTLILRESCGCGVQR